VWRSSVVNYHVLIHFILKNALSMMRVTNLLAVEVGSHHYNSFTSFVDNNPIHFCSCLEILSFGMVKRDCCFRCLDAYLPSGLCLCMLIFEYLYSWLSPFEYWVLSTSVEKSCMKWKGLHDYDQLLHTVRPHFYQEKNKIIWFHCNIIF